MTVHAAEAARGLVERDAQRGYLLANALQLGARIVEAAEQVMRAAVDAGAFPER